MCLCFTVYHLCAWIFTFVISVFPVRVTWLDLDLGSKDHLEFEACVFPVRSTDKHGVHVDHCGPDISPDIL